MTRSTFQSRKWQLIGMSYWYRGTLCGHPLLMPANNWTRDAASRHTTAPISHVRPSPIASKLLLISCPVEDRSLSWSDLVAESFVLMWKGFSAWRVSESLAAHWLTLQASTEGRRLSWPDIVHPLRLAGWVDQTLCLCWRDATHGEWAKAWSSTLTQLQAYIKQFHTTGVEWNKQVCTFSITCTAVMYVCMYVCMYVHRGP